MIMKLYAKKKWRVVLQALACILIMSGTFVALTHRNAAHASGSATINVSPTSGAYLSGPISVTGANFQANESVQVYWNYTGPGTGTLERTAIASGVGAFSVQFPTPLSPTGTYTIAAIGQTSQFVATGTYLLLPEMPVTPLAGGPGSQLTMNGKAFGAGEVVKIYWNYTGPGTGTLLASPTGDSNGSFSAGASVPTGTAAGRITIAGVGQTSNTVAKFTFTLYPSLLTLAPLRGSSNSPLTLSAYGFKGGEQVSIYWNNGSTPLRTVSTNGFGYMSPLAITVPAKTPPGNYPVKVVGQTSTSTITNTYTVVGPGTSIDRTSGPVGSTVKLSGQGYAPKESVTILWNYTGPGTGTSIGSASAGVTGAFVSSFTVPSATTGAYNVAAVGATSKRVSQNAFTVANGLAANPANTPPGTTVTASGSGYQPGESVNIYWDSTSGSLLATATADVNGNINHTVTTPGNATTGTHSLIGVGQTSAHSFTASLTINTNWGDFGFTLDHHRQNAYENTLAPLNVGNLTLKWSASTAKPFYGSAVYANGLVYQAALGGFLNAYNATTGVPLWQYNTQTGFTNVSSPMVDTTTNTVFFGTVAQWNPGIPSPVYALDATSGVLKWSLIIPWDEYGFPTLAFNTIYVGSTHEGGPGSLLALDVLSGHITWQYKSAGGIWGSVAVDASNNTVFTGIGNPVDAVVSLNATTGAFNWQYSVPNSAGDTDVGAGIAIDNGLVYVDSKNGSIYAIHENDGTYAWSTQIATDVDDVSSPAISSVLGILYVGSIDSNLYALNKQTGAVLWKIPTGGIIKSSPALANGVLYFASEDDKIYAANASNGNVLWSFKTANQSQSSPIVVNGWLYCGSTDGKLYAFSL